MWSCSGIACSLPVLLLVGLGVVSLIRWRRVRTAERVPIAEAASRAGVCEIAGTVEARDVVTHPAVDGPLAYATVYASLELDPGGAPRGKKKVTVEETITKDSIWVRDETGLARVVTFDAPITVADDHRLDYVRSDDGEPPEWLRAVLRDRRDIDPAAVRRATGSVEYIRPGDPLYVLGYAEPEQSGDAMYRDPKVVATFRPRRGRPFMVANQEERQVRSMELGCGVGALIGAGLLVLLWLGIFGGFV